MKRAISLFMTLVLMGTSLFSLSANAISYSKSYSYTDPDGSIVFYQKDANGTYIIENNKKVYIAIPVLIDKITDEETLTELRASIGNIESSNSVLASSLPYSKTMNFSSTSLIFTDVLSVTGDFYMKCSDLEPFGSDRGFSYWIHYSYDGVNWERALYVNQSLLFYTRHRHAELGNSPYIKIHMWSYYGTVSSCLLSIK